MCFAHASLAPSSAILDPPLIYSIHCVSIMLVIMYVPLAVEVPWEL